MFIMTNAQYKNENVIKGTIQNVTIFTSVQIFFFQTLSNFKKCTHQYFFNVKN